MDRAEIFDTMRHYLSELLEVPPESISGEARLREDLDLDSIDAIDLISKMQELTGVRIDPDQFKSVKSVDDVVARVYELVSAKN
ncbi:MAG: acyl carrier protein [Pseudomonadota bacterium]